MRGEFTLRVEEPAAGAAPELIFIRAREPARYVVLRIVTESTIDGLGTRTGAKLGPRRREFFGGRMLSGFVRRLQPIYVLADVLNEFVTGIGMFAAGGFIRIRKICFRQVWSIRLHIATYSSETTG